MKALISVAKVRSRIASPQTKGLSVLEIKQIIQALVASGVKYSQIADVAEVDPNTLKQFTRRKPGKPRKTPLYYTLTRFISALDDELLNKLCANEPSLAPIFWREEIPASLKSLTKRGETDSLSQDTQSTIANALAQRDLSETILSTDYYLYRPFSDRKGIIKSRIMIRATSRGLEFKHDQEGVSGEYTGIIIINRRRDIYLIGPLNRAVSSREIMLFIPPAVESSDLTYGLSNRTSEDAKAPFFSGVMVAFDKLGVPLACRAALLSANFVNSSELGVFEPERFEESEKRFFDLLNNLTKKKIGEELISSDPFGDLTISAWRNKIVGKDAAKMG